MDGEKEAIESKWMQDFPQFASLQSVKKCISRVLKGSHILHQLCESSH